VLARLRQILGESKTWESFLFVDAYELARTGKMKDAGVQMVRQLQCLEFELLFRHCCETALGEDLVKRAEPGTLQDHEARLQQMRQLKEKHRPRRPRPEGGERETPDQEDTAGPQQETRIKVGCPKCKSAMDLSATARGQCTKCTRCGTAFMVPIGQGGGLANAGALGSLIGIRCPKCREMLMFPEMARGKKEKCCKCGVVFLVPQKRPAALTPAGGS
jgi:hypothetical protein